MHIHDFTARRPDWQVLPQWAVEECEERCNVPRASLLFFARTALLTPAPSGTVCHDANLTAFRLLHNSTNFTTCVNLNNATGTTSTASCSRRSGRTTAR
jgi:hypothetical protein